MIIIIIIIKLTTLFMFFFTGAKLLRLFSDFIKQAGSTGPSPNVIFSSNLDLLVTSRSRDRSIARHEMVMVFIGISD